MWEIGLPKIALAATLFGTSAFAEEDLGQEWIGAMNACEALVSDQSFAGFQNYSDAQSILNVEPQLERGFQHPDLPLNASAISDGSEWFMCVVTGDTGNEQGEIIGTVTGTLLAQIRDYGNHTIVFEDGKTFAPVRVICQDDGQLTSVFAFYDEEQELRVAAINRLPDGADSPCR
ncbi:MAG: hypothetical protein ABJO67_06610 [Pseudoruegeria sp.]